MEYLVRCSVVKNDSIWKGQSGKIEYEVAFDE